MIIDGKILASNILRRVAESITTLPRPPRLAVVLMGDNPAITSFVAIKRRKAKEVGAEFSEHALPPEASTDDICRLLSELAGDHSVDGIVVQLPLLPHVDTPHVLDILPPEKDVDVLSHKAMAAFRKGESPVLPPVAGAIQAILEDAHYDVSGKDVLVLGHGRLVGAPAALFLRHNHAHVTVVDQPTQDLAVFTREADVIVSGVGMPGLLTPDMLKDGVVLIDAGTSESAGKIVGDADGACAERATLFTPVPGGVGPVTVAILFKNLVLLALRSQSGDNKSTRKL